MGKLRAEPRFGVLGYSSFNVGDDIQSLAAMRFLPRVDARPDRDRLPLYRFAGPLHVIANGFFLPDPVRATVSRGLKRVALGLGLERRMRSLIAGARRLELRLPPMWPPPPRLRMLWLSVHISAWAAPTLLAGSYLRSQGPIGCRDRGTVRRLEEHGIPAWFSGCLTLTLPPAPGPRGDAIVLVDVPAVVRDALPKELRAQVLARTHVLLAGHRDRLGQARRLLETYRSARLVITSRLHCALPCLAFGTPVLFVHPSPHDPRLGGLIELVRHCTPRDFPRFARSIDWRNPAPNPERHHDLRRALASRCEAFVAEALA